MHEGVLLKGVSVTNLNMCVEVCCSRRNALGKLLMLPRSWTSP